jgi:hypothetical protein
MRPRGAAMRPSSAAQVRKQARQQSGSDRLRRVLLEACGPRRPINEVDVAVLSQAI